jgi:hypothetical protein
MAGHIGATRSWTAVAAADYETFDGCLLVMSPKGHQIRLIPDIPATPTSARLSPSTTVEQLPVSSASKKLNFGIVSRTEAGSLNVLPLLLAPRSADEPAGITAIAVATATDGSGVEQVKASLPRDSGEDPT